MSFYSTENKISELNSFINESNWEMNLLIGHNYISLRWRESVVELP